MPGPTDPDASAQRAGRMRRRVTAAAVLMAALGALLAPAPAVALSPLEPICKVAQLGSGAAGKLCQVASSPGKLLKAGGKLITGHIGGAFQTVFGGGGGGRSTATTAIALAAIGVWVLGGAKFALHETAQVLGHTTSPRLGGTWFSSAYWRMAALASLLTLPFLFAAAVQALVRGDLGLLTRAAFGYLPLAMLAVGIAAPLTMLLLAASDQLSAIVAAAAGHESVNFLARAGTVVGVLSVFKGSPFLAFLVGLIAAAGALALWLELLMREAAVYIVVLMLPLAFAAMVWPARRIWAVRSVELLVALILSKFAIVAVLALGGAALSHGWSSITAALAGAVLVLLGAFAPWALLRLLPLAELASGAAGSLRSHAQLPIGGTSPEATGLLTGPAAGWAGALTAGMRRQAEEARSDPSGAEVESTEAGTGRLAGAARIPAGVETDAADPLRGAVPALVGAGEQAGSGSGPVDGSTVRSNGFDSDAARSEESDASTERSPGMEPMWQAPDVSWRPYELGGEVPQPPLWPWSVVEGGPATPAAEGGPAMPGETGRPAKPADDDQPLPPSQDHEDGPL